MSWLLVYVFYESTLLKSFEIKFKNALMHVAVTRDMSSITLRPVITLITYIALKSGKHKSIYINAGCRETGIALVY